MGSEYDGSFSSSLLAFVNVDEKYEEIKNLTNVNQIKSGSVIQFVSSGK